jgi:hypothetical protein
MIDVEVKGLIELQRKAVQMITDTHGAPILQAMRDSTMHLSSLAKQNLVGYQSAEVGGVDTGVLRASITPDVRMDGNDVVGVVGSSIYYAPFVEYGTRPHFPPMSALQLWAERHGVDVFIVWRAIGTRGTKPKEFLTKAFNSAQDWIKQRFDRAAQEIVNK